MPDKRNMKIILQRLCIHMKSLRINLFLPILIADVFLPLICMFTYMGEHSRINFAQTVISFSMLIIPLCSVWWSIFINRYYIEGQGNELLYVCKNKIKTLDTLLSFVIFYFTSIIQFAAYINIDDSLVYEPLKLFIISLFYYASTQFFAFLTGSVAITLFSAFGYLLISFIITASGSQYIDLYDFSLEIFLTMYLPLIIVSAVLLIISIILNKKRIKFN